MPQASFIVSGIAQDFRGANNYRPNVTCDPYSSDRSITNYFNKDCVVTPTDPSQPFGNAVRNSVRGPNFWSFDLAVSKYFPLAGRLKAQLRLEAFNLFNRANFTAPNGHQLQSGPLFDFIPVVSAEGIEVAVNGQVRLKRAENFTR